MKLEGKSVLITGAASGIGKAAALLFVEEGARLTLVDVNEAGEETARQAHEKGAEATFLKADVSKSGDWEKAVRLAVESHGRIDVLYNNAGIGMYRPFLETSEEDWDRVIAVDLKSVYLGCRHAIPEMIKRGGGVIVNTASEIGISGARNYAAYCAAKGGVVQITRALALEFGDRNIRVNCLCPGVTLTPMLEQGMNRAQDPAARRRYLEQGVPLKRLGRPEEIAKGALFLACDDSSFMNGATLVIDGGATA
ncbi:MAG: SDR family NAD(P)-dependent oxidoreductase [Candidatus Bathyarchaeota archaeon]|nr:SDR family NAD(P)-dependent oxidoreductase [Candidatus Bathyarchaeota archaeon]